MLRSVPSSAALATPALAPATLAPPPPLPPPSPSPPPLPPLAATLAAALAAAAAPAPDASAAVTSARATSARAHLPQMGITFIGPNETSMFLLGDKIASTIIAQSAGVPCISWSGSGVDVVADADGKVTSMDDAVFAKACVNTAEEAVEVAERVGYPIMIKASEGGGGKGVRKAKCRADIEPMFRQVADEVKGSPIFLMRLCDGARHIEVQVMADKHRNVSILSGRDCSMQRRFQKIVEEGPPRAVAPETLDQMERAAASLCRMVNYTHAGTVEYLFIQETQEFYFLELNPRLQAGTRYLHIHTWHTLQRHTAERDDSAERERERVCCNTLPRHAQRRTAETRCRDALRCRRSLPSIEPAADLGDVRRRISADLG